MELVNRAADVMFGQGPIGVIVLAGLFALGWICKRLFNGKDGIVTKYAEKVAAAEERESEAAITATNRQAEHQIEFMNGISSMMSKMHETQTSQAVEIRLLGSEIRAMNTNVLKLLEDYQKIHNATLTEHYKAMESMFRVALNKEE